MSLERLFYVEKDVLHKISDIFSLLQFELQLTFALTKGFFFVLIPSKKHFLSVIKIKIRWNLMQKKEF